MVVNKLKFIAPKSYIMFPSLFVKVLRSWSVPSFVFIKSLPSSRLQPVAIGKNAQAKCRLASWLALLSSVSNCSTISSRRVMICILISKLTLELDKLFNSENTFGKANMEWNFISNFLSLLSEYGVRDSWSIAIYGDYSPL